MGDRPRNPAWPTAQGCPNCCPVRQVMLLGSSQLCLQVLDGGSAHLCRWGWFLLGAPGRPCPWLPRLLEPQGRPSIPSQQLAAVQVCSLLPSYKGPVSPRIPMWTSQGHSAYHLPSCLTSLHPKHCKDQVPSKNQFNDKMLPQGRPTAHAGQGAWWGVQRGESASCS